MTEAYECQREGHKDGKMLWAEEFYTQERRLPGLSRVAGKACHEPCHRSIHLSRMKSHTIRWPEERVSRSTVGPTRRSGMNVGRHEC
jgi:hypothetical protein